MKKKIIKLLGVSSLLLVACGEEEQTTEEPQTEETESTEETQNEEVEQTSNEETNDDTEETEADGTSDVGETEDSEMGSITTVAQELDINETQTSGDFDVTLQNAQLSQMQPAEDYVDMFGGEDVAVVSFEVEVVNNSENTNAIHPNQGTIVTDGGDQIDADLWMSDDVGGEFLGEVTKQGAVQFIFDGDAEEVNDARYVIRSGHAVDDYEQFDEDIEFSVDF